MKIYWGGSIAPRILTLGARWRWVISVTLRPLNLRENDSKYPVDRSLGGLQSRSERGGEEKKIPAPAGNWTPVFQPVD
jgi:hypothetical protein